MQIKPLNVGGVRLDGNLLLAPLAGYTDFAFRAICCELGASLAFTEMVSCKGLMYNNENTSVLLTVSDGERVKAAQIFGNDPSIMRSACESEHLAPFDIIDINMGCPVPKLFKNGEGSALLENIALAERIISECKKSGKVITVKFRTGVTPDRLVTEEFARMCEGAGASMYSFTMQLDGSLFSGAEAGPVLRSLEEAGAAAVGFNCVAADMMTPYLVSKLRRYAKGPLLCKPNAGNPTINMQGVAEYSMGPEEFADILRQCEANGATLLGGCCGTAPEFIAQLLKSD